MINEKEKWEFIQERYGSYPDSIKTNRFGSMKILCEAEDFYHKDLSDLSDNQLNALLEKLANTYTNYTRYKSLINDYNIWKSSPNRATFQWDEVGNSDEFSQKYVRDFDELYSLVADNLDVRSSSAEAFYALIIFLCWSGLSKEDIISIEKDGVNYIEGSIAVNDKTYRNIESRIIEQCRYCSEIYEYQDTHFKLLNNKYLFRRRYKEGVDPDSKIFIFTITHAFNRFNSYDLTNYTYNTIRKSGLYDECHQANIDEHLNKYDIYQIFNSIASNRFHKNVKSGQILYHDYELWKEFFYG